MKKKLELTEHQIDMSRRRRTQQQALAILRRAREAGIPPLDMRVPESELYAMIDPNYFVLKDLTTSKESETYTKSFCHSLFADQNILLKTPFIIIDGGNFYERKRAGFALLFRIIAWDKTGNHISCIQAVHATNTWEGSAGKSRSETVSSLKESDVLFISECATSLFSKPSLEAGGFFDEILQDREASGKITILSFPSIASSKNASSLDEVSDLSAGQYISMFTQSDSKKGGYKNILRMRIKTNG